ncbi:MAG: site-specific DNA-methyltransferase [Chloroflexi bacterium]|uniref:Site-specific DNA-methyltransferase n=1 Tax=Candidatus Chlorohelix allophototropha TaxID=3003348 RepID=A0A8T7MAR3_9CHLR|nr:site-specific DNA-methyltransferase [Chloroflexota bacterium]WJW70440.1 site-specific DNA-methyltransferase [Chloroflexota bacterium L227-S17]
MPPKNNKQNNPTPVDALKHKDTRVNIPTNELQEFVAEEEQKPKTLLYPRDPSLDPQLVWKGKDEQDAAALEVPAVPIYIQEKIHPQAIIEDLRAEARKETPQQLSLFSDFNGIENFEDLVDFYQHEQHWSNRMILGDSLLVMASLAEKEGLKGKVQMIYLDPPYGIKFGSNWQTSTRKRDVKDGKAEDLTRQPEQIKAFRDTWKLGIHSYLAYLRDRLMVAQELLTESGSIFVQIGGENVHLVRNLLDEVFGSENFVSFISFQKTGGVQSNFLPSSVDYLLWYAKEKIQARSKFRQIYQTRNQGETSLERYDQVEEANGLQRNLTVEERKNGLLQQGAKRYQLAPIYSEGESSDTKEFKFHGKGYKLRPGTHWKTTSDGLQKLSFSGRLEEMGSVIRYKRFVDDFPVIPITDHWESMQIGTERVYVVQTSLLVIQRCLLMTTDPGDLIFDPTCGSGTTAYVAEQWGRRWITCDTSRVSLALARTRLMAARFPYFLLSDSPDGVKKEADVTGRIPPDYPTSGDIRKGFVYKRVPHVTLKAIANNQEIDTIHAKYQERLEALRQQLNSLLHHNWEEWQIPREPDKSWNEQALKAHEQWWQLRRQRQQEIDASISRNAEVELLYDQPYEDNKRIRVSGPFTVESLSPHRVISADEERPATEQDGQKQQSGGDFLNMVLDNLKKAGVQNTVKTERLKFDLLEPFAGEWLHLHGEYTEPDGSTHRVAVSIGSQHGTVGSEQIKGAAREALKGAGFDLLLVCGFAFDPYASETVREFSPSPEATGKNFAIAEERKQYGKLPVLLVRMNPDLLIGEDLLKKTGAGNLFMVFGEPDIKIDKDAEGKLVVTLQGLDIYNPTTGEISPYSTDKIACWFIDTAYNEESFFVRHAYFTGADQPYEKLKRALKAEVDEAAWSSLYSTTSRPFERPASGKIAVKVINHYGDEVLKVYRV